jgi:outer membrane protein assembly factor BamB
MLSLTLFALLAAADPVDWSRFRGPNGSGVAETTGLPDAFGPAQNVIWRKALPAGYSSPIVSGGLLFVTAEENGKLLTIALDPVSGTEKWKRESPRDRQEKLDRRNGPASPSVAADGKSVFVFFPDYGLLSYDFKGKERWRTPLGPFNNIYGMGASPMLVGDRVILVCDQASGSFITAFEAGTGREVWRKARPEAISGHSTPVLYQPKGASEPLILAPGSLRMDAYAPSDGRSVWWVNALPGEMKSGPVLLGDTVFVSGFNTPQNDPGAHVAVLPFEEMLSKFDADHNGLLATAEVTDKQISENFFFIDLDSNGAINPAEWRMYMANVASENGLLAFRANGEGDMTQKGLVWKYQRSVPQLPTVLVYRDVLYMINDGGVLTTFNPTSGAVLKQARLRGAVDSYYASPVAADGKVYIASRSGIVAVLKAGGDQEVLSLNKLDEEIYATPAIVGDRIFLRTASTLYCFGLKSAK